MGTAVSQMLVKIYAGFSDHQIIKIYKEAKAEDHVVPELKQEIESRMQTWISCVKAIHVIESNRIISEAKREPYEDTETLIHMKKFEGK